MATWYLQTRNQRASAGRGKAHAMYVAGNGLYADKDEVIFVKDYNLPPWAKDGADFLIPQTNTKEPTAGLFALS